MSPDTYMREYWLRRRKFYHLLDSPSMERFREICTRLRGDKFLEVGCRAGHSTQILDSIYPGDWWGCDESGVGLDYARENFKKWFPKEPFLRYRNNRLPFANNAFDYVICAHGLDHIKDDKAIVQELLRVAGQWVVVTVPFGDTIGDPGYFRVYDESSLRVLFRPSPTILINQIANGHFWLVQAQAMP